MPAAPCTPPLKSWASVPNACRRIPGSGFGVPQGIDREGAQAVSEGERLLACVENVSGYQSRAQSLGEVAQAGQVFAADGRSGFHLDGDHPAVRGFQDGVR